MSASISTKSKNVGLDFLKRTAGVITGATGGYISDVMTVTSSTISEASSTISSVNTKFRNTTQAVMPKLHQLRTQINIKNIMNWYMNKEDDFSGSGMSDSDFQFDISTDSADIAEAQITELDKSANKISQAVVESSHKLAESQIAATANLLATAQNQTAVISAGFDKTNTTLNKILEVLTKNTATLIETTVAANNSNKKSNDDMLASGKFDMHNYKNIIKDNFSNSQYGTLASMASMMANPNMAKTMLTPEFLLQNVIGFGLKKKSPNLKKNLEALDKAVSDTIMTSLIRLGENDKFSFGGELARMFGIDSKRKNADTSRSTLELKTVPFDSIAHESITNAIPGYLRKILVAVGGEDVVYDYRARTFKSKGAIKREFHQEAVVKNSLGGASNNVRKAVGQDEFGSMVYDLMMTELGNRTQGGGARKTITKMSNPKEAEKYLLNTLLAQVGLTPEELKRAKEMAPNIAKAVQNGAGIDIMNQAARTNVQRNSRTSNYVKTANAYNIDLSEIRDSYDADIETILESFGKSKKGNKRRSGATSVANPKSNLVGVNYTNMALYEIYRKLNEGINVFQVGSNTMRSDPFKKRGDDYLSRPQTYKPRPLSDNLAGASVNRSLVSASNNSDDPNLLQNQDLEDGTSEDLTKGQRFKRWGKKRGGNLMQAIFSGNPEQVRDAFGLMIRDVGQTGAGFVKDKVSSINKGNGNITGYLKHKITGSGYKYINDEGKEVEIGKNEKGGMLGYFDEILFGPGGHKKMMEGISAKGSKWFKSVSGYFNFGSSDPEDKKVEGKRKHILGTSVGAMLGMGLLGGPLGIIMGGVAGSALSQTNGIGDKIKKMLFGDKEHEGDKRKDRNKRRGLIGRAVDNIVDPIRYQVGKTMTTFSSVLKKNILGPLSNIGVAIKDRMSNAAGGVVSKVFGKIFGGMGSVIKKLLMFPLNVAKAPITMVGNFARGGIKAGGGLVGGALNSVAKGIASSKEGKANIKNRIKGQRHDADIDEAESGYFGDYEFDYEQDPNGPHGKMIKTAKKTSKKRDYKAWKEQQDINRDKMNIDEYTKETTVAVKDVAESNAEIAQDVSTLAHLGSEKGSIFTHDDGLHNRIDSIIDILKDKMPGLSNQSGIHSDKNSNKLFEKISIDNERDSFASSAIPGAMSLIVSGDDVGDNEARLASGIIDDAAKPNSRKESISTKLKDLMGIQKKKSDNGDKKESIFEKIFSFLGKAGNVLKSLIPLGGIIALFYGLFKNGGLTDLLERLGVSADNLLGLLDKDSEESKDPTTTGMNAVTALGDARVENSFDWANPFAKIYHNKKDGAGENITNSAVTDAKNAPVKWSITKDLLSNTWGNIKQNKYSNKAATLSAQADAYRLDGANVRADLTEARAKNAQKAADAGAKQATAPKTDTLKTVGRNVARVGVINVAGNLAGNLGSGIASAVGADEETSATIGRVSNAAASGAIVVNTATSALKPGKKAWIDKIIDGVTKLIKFIADKIGADKAVKKIGASKVVTTLTSSISKIVGSLKTKIDDIFISKVEAKLAALGVKNAASAATAGIAIAVGAVAGLASGFCGTEHLFGVLPGDSDAGMKTISSLFGAAFGALEMTPAGWVVCILDIIDGVLTSIPGIGVGIKQFLARSLYKLFGGSEKLEEKQAKMEADRQYLKDTYGVELNAATHNDEVNNTGLMSRMWSGKAKLDENDHVIRDDAGAVLKQGGMKSWFVGNEKQYEKDETGAVIRDEEGNAIQAVDKYGKGIKKDKKWGDHVGGFFSGVGRFFGGSTEYETDENGQAIRGEDGEYVVKEKKGNIFQRTGSAISSGYTALKGKATEVIDSAGKKLSSIKDSALDTVKNVGSSIAGGAKNIGKGVMNFFGFGSGDTEEDVEKELESEVNKDSKLKDFIGKSKDVLKEKGVGGIIKAAASKATDIITNPIKSLASGIKKISSSNEEVDADGNTLTDENGKAIKKGKLGEWALASLGGFTGLAVKTAKEIGSTVRDMTGEKYVTDENGQVISEIGSKNKKLEKNKLADYLKTGISKITNFLTSPIKEMVDGADEWSDKDSPWKKDGKKTIASWIGEKVGGFWNNIVEGISSLTESSDTSKGGVGGGKLTKALGGMGGPESEDTILDGLTSGATSMSSITSEEGGNPLNKPYTITSPYGQRTKPKVSFHKGIDLVPASSDGTPTEVGARYAGTITEVKADVKDSDRAYKRGTSWVYNGRNDTGNMVTIKSDSGKIIKNMHLKHGSIPSNIKVGAKVSPGDKIGVMGTTGWSTGDHLHYQIEDSNGKTVDPVKYVKGGAQIASFASNGTSSTLDLEGVPGDTETASSVMETGEAESGFSAVISAITKAGKAFLNAITGGLLFGDEVGNSSSSLSSEESANTTVDNYGVSIGSSGAAGKVDGPVELKKTAEVAAIQSKREKKEVIDLTTGKSFFISWAASPNYHSDWTPWSPADVKTIWSLLHPDGGGNMNKTSDWSWNARPGILKLNGHMIACGFHLRPHAALMGGNPGAPFTSKSNKAYAYSKTEKWPLGGHMCMYYHDSPGGTQKCNEAAVKAYELGNKLYQTQASASESGDTSGNVNISGENGKDIWNLLKAKGYTNTAIAGLMGNLDHESGLYPDRVQGDIPRSNKSIEYAQKVDSNAISKDQFVKKGPGGGGFGLAQWTYPSRKQGLWEYTKAKGKSISDLSGQVDYLHHELTGYGLVDKINAANSIKDASNIILHDFEKPANQSASVENERANKGQAYFNKYANSNGSSVLKQNDAKNGIQKISDTPSNTALGMGGDEESYNINQSSLGSPKFTKLTKRNTSNQLSPSLSSYNSYRTNQYNSTDNSGITGTLNTAMNDSNDKIVNLIIQIIGELKSIVSNTGNSNSLLSNLGQLSGNTGTTSSGIHNTKKSYATRHVSTGTSTRSITAMARP